MNEDITEEQRLRGELGMEILKQRQEVIDWGIEHGKTAEQQDQALAAFRDWVDFLCATQGLKWDHVENCFADDV